MLCRFANAVGQEESLLVSPPEHLAGPIRFLGGGEFLGLVCNAGQSALFETRTGTIFSNEQHSKQ